VLEHQDLRRVYGYQLHVAPEPIFYVRDRFFLLVKALAKFVRLRAERGIGQGQRYEGYAQSHGEEALHSSEGGCFHLQIPIRRTARSRNAPNPSAAYGSKIRKSF
jgi:hypothetical protein